MNEERVHRSNSTDGTQITGRVHGRGPALVFVHGVTGDGDVDWDRLLPGVAEQFTCYLMSTRGRGSSADHPSHSDVAILQDVVSFVESIGEPVGLIGFSSGGGYALHAAAESPAVVGVVAYEPALEVVFTPEEGARVGKAVGRAGVAMASGNYAHCIQEFTTNSVATADEVISLASSGYYQAAARNAPALMQAFAQHSEFRMGDASALARIEQPTLLLRGTASAMSLFADAVDHAAAHVPVVRVREFRGLAHFAPILTPEPIAEEIVRFFEETLPVS